MKRIIFYKRSLAKSRSVNNDDDLRHALVTMQSFYGAASHAEVDVSRAKARPREDPN